MAKTCWRGVGAATIALLLCMGCTSSGDESLSAQATLSLNPYGEWIWTLTDPFGCPTAVEQEFPFLNLDNKRFEVFDTGKGGLGAEFEDDAGNTIEMEGTFNSSTGLVDVTFCITERPPLLTGNGATICENAKGYVTDPAIGVHAFDLGDTGNQQVMVTGGDFSDPRDMGASRDGRWVLVPNHGNDTVSLIDTSTDTVVQTIGSGLFSGPTSAAFNPSLPIAYVLNEPLKGSSANRAYIRCLDTTSVPFTDLGTIPLERREATGLCAQPDGNLLIALFGDEETFAVIDMSNDTVLLPEVPTIAEACQCAFDPSGSLLAVVGGSGMALHDVSTFFVTEQFTSFPDVSGWDIAISSDGNRAYIGLGDKGGDRLVSGMFTPRVRCFDLVTNQEITDNLPDTGGGPVWGVDICEDYAFYTDSARVGAFHIPNHNVMDLGFAEIGRYVRVAQPREPVFQPRIIKIQFTAQLTFLDNMRQLDGISQIIDIIGFQFACQTVVSENTWVFIQDLVE